MPQTLGYWKYRGDVQPIRYMLEYLDNEYTDKIYDVGEVPFFDVPPWEEMECHCKVQCERHTEEVTVPYFINNAGLLILGSMHIINHIAIRKDLLGCDDVENGKAAFAEKEALEMRKNWDTLVYDKQAHYEDKKIAYRENLEIKLKKLSELLEDAWFAGLTLTYVDFMLYELVDINCVLFPDCLDPYYNLQEFKERFENLYRINSYIKSSRFLKNNINSLQASVCTGEEF